MRRIHLPHLRRSEVPAEMRKHSTLAVELLGEPLHFADISLKLEGTLAVKNRSVQFHAVPHVVFVHFLAVFFRGVRRDECEILARLLVEFGRRCDAQGCFKTWLGAFYIERALFVGADALVEDGLFHPFDLLFVPIIKYFIAAMHRLPEDVVVEAAQAITQQVLIMVARTTQSACIRFSVSDVYRRHRGSQRRHRLRLLSAGIMIVVKLASLIHVFNFFLTFVIYLKINLLY